MDNSALLPCPFCGADGVLKRSSVPTHGGRSFARGWVGCPHCSAYIQWTRDPAAAVRIWNGRAAR